MSEEVKNVHREPHPFVGSVHMANFVGRPIAFVGRIQQVNDGELIMQQNDRKYSLSHLLRSAIVERAIEELF